MATFNEKLQAKWDEGKSVCVGLDSELSKIPHEAHRTGGIHTDIDDWCHYTLREFNQRIVGATHDLVCAYKPNLAFYMAHGDKGLLALRDTIEYIRKVAPDVPVILDAKIADIGNTNRGYVEMAFEYLDADAVTVHPYLGEEALQPFLDRKDKGIIVLCRTSNPGSWEFQDLNVEIHGGMFMLLYKAVAKQVSERWNANGNCAVVVGATYPEELAQVRRIVGDMPILIPGIGAQGGDVEATVKAGMNSRGQGMIINSSRGIIFASSGEDFAEVARRETLKLNDLINQYRT